MDGNKLFDFGEVEGVATEPIAISGGTIAFTGEGLLIQRKAKAHNIPFSAISKVEFTKATGNTDGVFGVYSRVGNVGVKFAHEQNTAMSELAAHVSSHCNSPSTASGAGEKMTPHEKQSIKKIGCIFSAICLVIFFIATSTTVMVVAIVLAALGIIPLFALRLTGEDRAILEAYNAERTTYNQLYGVNFAVNESERRLLLNDKVYKWGDVLGAEIIEDESVVSKTDIKGRERSKRNLSLGKAVVGGALFGPMGALGGASLGGRKTKTKITQTSTTAETKYCTMLKLRVAVSGTLTEPFEIIDFLPLGKEDMNSTSYRNKAELCERCFAIVQNIVDLNEDSEAEQAE